MSDNLLFEHLSKHLQDRHQRVLANTKLGVSALVNADTNGDGKLSGEEQIRAFDAGLWSEEFRQKTLPQLNCQRDPKAAALMAAETVVQLNRSLNVLKTGKPGQDAKALADSTIEAILSSMAQQMGNMPGAQALAISPEQRDQLKKTYEAFIQTEDRAMLSAYQALPANQKRPLPTEVLPLDPNLLCQRAGRRSL